MVVKSTIKEIKILQIKLQEDVSSVEIDLARGKHGYLFLVLIDTDHVSTLSKTLLVTPVHPSLLVTPPPATPIEELELKDKYDEKNMHLEFKTSKKCYFDTLKMHLKTHLLNS